VNLLGAMARGILDRLFPWSCLGCGQADSSPLCPLCLARVGWITGPCCRRCGIPVGSPPERVCGRCLIDPPCFRRLRAVACYRSGHEDHDPLGSALRTLKYGARRALAAPLSRILAERLPFASREHDVVAPVPLHLARLRERGFNQALLLAREPAARLGVAIDARLLVRIRATAPQVGLGEAERRQNLRAAIAVRSDRRVEGLRILLVDDVCTTTATADACSRALLAAGAAAVDVAVLARALLR
jgi:ComF family protein